jgi:hypothetical protein
MKPSVRPATMRPTPERRIDKGTVDSGCAMMDINNYVDMSQTENYHVTMKERDMGPQLMCFCNVVQLG